MKVIAKEWLINKNTAYEAGEVFEIEEITAEIKDKVEAIDKPKKDTKKDTKKEEK